MNNEMSIKTNTVYEKFTYWKLTMNAILQKILDNLFS